MRAPVAALAVLLLRGQMLAASVTPPTNVSFQCGNFQNTVRWAYDHVTPGLKFMVEYGQMSGADSETEPLWVEPPDLQADVSFLSDPINEYYVTVSAVVGDERSEASPPEGIIFSYIQASQAQYKCLLDLPPVTVSALEESKLSLRFQHPFVFYGDKMPQSFRSRMEKAMERVLEGFPLFSYSVVSQGSHYDFRCITDVCACELAVNGSLRRHCVEVTGELEKMKVQGPGEVCATLAPGHDNSTTIIAVVTALVVFVVGAVAMAIWKFVQPSSPRPSIFNKLVNGSPAEPPSPLAEEVIVVPEAVPLRAPGPPQTGGELGPPEEPCSGHMRIGGLRGGSVGAGASGEESQRDEDDDDEDDQPMFPSAYSQKRNMEALLSHLRDRAGSVDELEPGEPVETYRDAGASARI